MTPARSMTGFATGQATLGDGTLTVTVKSVNHRILDLVLRLPRSLESLESGVRAQIRRHLHRGHVELTVTLDQLTAPTLQLDRRLLQTCIKAWREAAAVLGAAAEPQVHELLRMPGILSVESPIAQLSPEIAAALTATTEQALTQLNRVRAAEGQTLAGELTAVAARLQALAQSAAELHRQAPITQQQRLHRRLASLLQGRPVDADRLLLEAALLAERADVDEELVRLETHIQTMQNLLAAGGELGRPLDFLLQELNREANTLLSKAGNHGVNGLTLTDVGLKMKLEIERAREQVQNLE